MELRVYDADLNFKGLTENQRSIVWTRKYGTVGSFDVFIPITDYSVGLFKIGNLVWMEGAKEAGVIEDITLSQNNTENEIAVRGRFLESYMDRRLVRPSINFSGTVENAMRTILQNAAPIPHVELEPLQGLTEEVTFQATYKNLLVYMEKLAKGAGYSFRFRPDFTAKKIIFEIFRGKDHTFKQMDNPRVTFSDGYDNLSEVKMNNCDILLKTVAYVGGEGEGAERKIVVVGDDTLTGLARREVFVDARDLQSTDLTEEEYLDKLRQRGYDALADDMASESIEFLTEARGNFEYRTHYDLGDVVTIQKESWGVSRDMRISEIMEVYEYSHAQVSLTLGDPIPEKINWEDV